MFCLATGCTTQPPRPDGGIMPVTAEGQPGWLMHDGTILLSGGKRFRPSNSADLMAEARIREQQGDNGGNDGADFMNALSGNPGLYYGASRSAALQGDIQKANAFRTLGDMTAWSGQQQHERKVAREGKTQINIINPSVPAPPTSSDPAKSANWVEAGPATGLPSSVEEDPHQILLIGGFTDLNMNGKHDPNESMLTLANGGLFYRNQVIMLLANSAQYGGRRITITIAHQNGYAIRRFSDVISNTPSQFSDQTSQNTPFWMSVASLPLILLKAAVEESSGQAIGGVRPFKFLFCLDDCSAPPESMDIYVDFDRDAP